MQKEIILYSTNCPKCIILKQRLDEEKISYKENTNRADMRALKIMSVPVLAVDENLLFFDEAMNWVNQKGEQS